MHYWKIFWNDFGIPIWPNIAASVLVWIFLKFQTAAIRKEHELTRQHAQEKHDSILAAVASNPPVKTEET